MHCLVFITETREFTTQKIPKRSSSFTTTIVSYLKTYIIRQPSFSILADFGLTEEELVLARLISENPDDQSISTAALVLRLREGMTSLPRILKTIENFKGQVAHVETRPSKKDGQFDVLVKVNMTRQNLSSLIRNLRQGSSLGGLTLLADNANAVTVKDPWFPRHASDLDNCNHLMTKYEPDLDMNHPGFADKEYRARR